MKRNLTDFFSQAPPKGSEGQNLGESETLLSPNLSLVYANKKVKVSDAHTPILKSVKDEISAQKENLNSKKKATTTHSASQTKKRCFNQDWLKDFDFLHFDEEKALMFCTLCQKHNKKIHLLKTALDLGMMSSLSIIELKCIKKQKMMQFL